jgi:hypothetical protein
MSDTEVKETETLRGVGGTDFDTPVALGGGIVRECSSRAGWAASREGAFPGVLAESV